MGICLPWSLWPQVRLHALTPVIVFGLLLLAWCVVVLVGLLANLEVCPIWCCQRTCCLKQFNYTSKSIAWGKLCALFVGLLRLMVPGIVSRVMRVWGCLEVNGRMFTTPFVQITDILKEKKKSKCTQIDKMWMG